MKFTPDYNVMYKGVFYEADKTFEIDEKDVKEMSRHGEVDWDGAFPEKDPEKDPENPSNQEDEPGEKPRQRGRPKKEV